MNNTAKSREPYETPQTSSRPPSPSARPVNAVTVHGKERRTKHAKELLKFLLTLQH